MSLFNCLICISNFFAFSSKDCIIICEVGSLEFLLFKFSVKAGLFDFPLNRSYILKLISDSDNFQKLSDCT